MSTQLITQPSKVSALAIKTCHSCFADLPETEFYLKGKDTKRRDTRCRVCRTAEVRNYRLKNPEIVKAIQKRTCAKHAEKHKERAAKWYSENHERAKEQMAKRRREQPETIKNEKLRLSFGITIHDYNRMMEDQGFCCAICGINNEKTKRSLAVDHCHITGRIRGLLCGKCNSAIGLLGESANNLRNAISYLETR
jgi:hypothetical protein